MTLHNIRFTLNNVRLRWRVQPLSPEQKLRKSRSDVEAHLLSKPYLGWRPVLEPRIVLASRTTHEAGTPHEAEKVFALPSAESAR
jgi:hypothetical protein